MKRPAAALPSAKSKPVAKDGAIGAKRAAKKNAVQQSVQFLQVVQVVLLTNRS